MNSPRKRRTWTKVEKSALAAEARRRLQAGEGMAQIASDLDVLEGSLRNWLIPSTSRALQPVAVIEDAVATSSLVLIIPGGARLEGLDVRSAAELLGRLR